MEKNNKNIEGATNSDLLVNPTYIQRYLGGGSNKPENNTEYMKNQLKLIKAGDKKLPPNLRQVPPTTTSASSITGQYTSPQSRTTNLMASGIGASTAANASIPSLPATPIKSKDVQDIYGRDLKDRYDPYTAYQYKHGLLNDGTNIRRYQTLYIDINSSFRSTVPTLQSATQFVLESNPLDFKLNSQSVFINHSNSGYKVGDLISINNVQGENVLLRTFDDAGNATFVIPGGCNFMKIFFPNDLPSTYTGSSVQIQLQGVQGDNGIKGVSYLGNIPVNLINTTHTLRLTLNQSDLAPGCNITNFPANYFSYNPGYFFIILPKVMQNPTGKPPYTLQEYNFRLIFLAIAGIPINLINSTYPIDPQHLQGYQIITSVKTNGYFINLSVPALSETIGGGSLVTVAQILAINPGFPNPNTYNIDIGETLNQIISARMVSSEFPNTEKTIRDFPLNRVNNKLYWNDIDTGDHLYSISVPPGNYTPHQLQPVLEQLFLNTPRIATTGVYLPDHVITVNIDTASGEVAFTTYKDARVVQPFVDVNPPIPPTPGGENPNAIYQVTVNQPAHGLTSPGEQIIISGAIATDGIPADVLNGQQLITKILNVNEYVITLPRFNLLADRTVTKGGVAVRILVPDLFRMIFTPSDTLGTVLGFRNPGQVNSITNFLNTITNQQPYAVDLTTDNLGNPIEITNNALQFNHNNYVMMIANPLQTLSSIGPTKDAFAKIQLCDVPGKVLFNSFAPTVIYYEDPLNLLEQLQIQILNPDGTLYDFDGVDHSFTMEIVIVSDIPDGTGISASTGRNYNSEV